MCRIMDSLHQYVPVVSYEKSIVLPNGEVRNHMKHDVFEILFGGDQLTVARARGAASVRANHLTTLDMLKGLVPTVEDWHCKVTLLKVYNIDNFLL